MARVVYMHADNAATGAPNAIDNSTSSVAIELADAGIAAGDFVSFLTTMTTTHIRWGTSAAVTCDHTTRNTGTPPDTVPAANAPHVTLIASAPQRVRVPAGVTHMAVISEAASGVLRFVKTVGQG